MTDAFNIKYILIDKKPVAEENLLKWADWFYAANRSVGDTRVGKKRVSTIFLGIDNNLLPEGKPILFETMVFPGCEEFGRCSTWEEAEKQHKLCVEILERRIKHGTDNKA